MIVAVPVATTGSMDATDRGCGREPGGLGVVGVGRAEQPEVVPELGDVQVDLVDGEGDGPTGRR